MEIAMPPNYRKNVKVQEFYATFRRDVAAFKEKLPQLLKQFPGEYVAVFNGEIVAHMKRWEDLVDMTQRDYPDKFVLLEKVVPKEKVVIDMDTLGG